MTEGNRVARKASKAPDTTGFLRLGECRSADLRKTYSAAVTIADVSPLLSLTAITFFLGACLAIVWLIFKTGYRIRT